MRAVSREMFAVADSSVTVTVVLRLARPPVLFSYVLTLLCLSSLPLLADAQPPQMHGGEHLRQLGKCGRLTVTQL